MTDKKSPTKDVKKKKVLEGIVVSNKMNKTVVVKVTSKAAHPMYKKILKTTKKYMAHAEGDFKVGTTVRIEQCKPMSRLKRWRVISKVESEK
jgi:small subunit ribosomal protein S17